MLRLLLAGLPCLIGGLSILQAGSYTVKPIRIELSARQLRTTIQVINLADQPATIQAHIVAWRAEGTEEILSPNDDVLLNPPIFTVGPGTVQSIRLGLRKPPPDSSEKTYRMILEEVPLPPSPDFAGVRTILKISVPIFITPKVFAPKLSWIARPLPDGQMALSVENRGNAHVQIKQIAVTSADRSEPDFIGSSFVYVLPNGRKEWVIRRDRPSMSDQIAVEAQTDYGDIHEVLAPGKP